VVIIKNTPAIASGPKTGPSLIDNQAQPVTHKKNEHHNGGGGGNA
jgi:hypothetical protein